MTTRCSRGPCPTGPVMSSPTAEQRSKVWTCCAAATRSSEMGPWVTSTVPLRSSLTHLCLGSLPNASHLMRVQVYIPFTYRYTHTHNVSYPLSADTATRVLILYL